MEEINQLKTKVSKVWKSKFRTSHFQRFQSTFFVSILITIIILFSTHVNAQETEKKPSALSVSADIVSSYLWRGMVGSPTISFQPSVSYNTGNVGFGFWGSVDNINYLREMDVFFTYSFKNLSFTFSDYYWDTSKKYFDYNNSTTAHVFELGVTYKNEKFPLQVYAGTMIYGNDKVISYDTTQTNAIKNNYSTYLELSYLFKINGNSLNVFVGATPYTGFYGKDFSVIFLGLTGKRDIIITDKFTLPIWATFAVNPQTEEYFVVMGISL